ncbi:MAG TPA: MMPL family transporter, partial [Pseudomonadales bacterium]|nr:MMPL family transporter [Pseudomonadales bacterium]
LFGFGIDPMSILVPFLIFAIAVSHSVQMISGWIGEVLYGADEQDVHHPVVPVNARTQGVDGYSAARRTFRRLLIPGSIAVLCNILGFVTILMINIGIIQEMGITASIGVTIIILTNLLLLPILLSFINLPNIEQYRQKRVAAESKRDGLWRTLSKFATTAWSIPTLVIIAITTVMAHFYSQGLQVGDLHAGVSELREEARYNLDTKMVTSKFAIGVDVLSVIVETPKNACIDYDTMVAMDELHWFAQNLPGVQSVLSLSEAMKIVTGGNNEGSPRWETLMRNQYNLSGALRYMETSSGLMDAECTAMPLLIYTKDHKADTVETIVRALEKYDSGLPKEKFNPRLASANVGIIAATNQAVHAAQEPIMAYVHGAIALLVLLSFRSVMVTACLMIPLLYVSSLCYALMTYLNIGLKVNTLPVVALGIGIGVDYGIYLYSRMADFLNEGLGLQESLYRALKLTGKPVMFTAATLAVGVATWIFSDLKFQADMGILLTFMFIVNMIGAILVIPALARWLLPARLRNPSTPAG